MKIVLMKVGNSYTVSVFDETKMIPDPRFLRVYSYAAAPPAEVFLKQQQGESDEEFSRRKEEAAIAEVARIPDHEAMIVTEAETAYNDEFNEVAPVLVSEKVV